MADAGDVANVQDLLPDTADADGWTSEKISVYLDADRSVYEVLQTYWESKVAKLYAMIDVSESGSSRSLSQIVQNAKAQAEYWRDRVAAEDAEEDKDANSHIAFHKITRV